MKERAVPVNEVVEEPIPVRVKGSTAHEELSLSDDVGDQKDKISPDTQKHLVTVDTSLGEVINWNSVGDGLLFDHKSFLELPDEVVRDLSYKNREAYFVSRGMKIQLESMVRKPKARTILDPFSNIIVQRTKRVKNKYKKGNREWHQTWVWPGKVDDMKTLGYVVVRDESNGETMKLMNGESVEAVAMEVPYDIYAQHLEAMSQKSQAAYKANKRTIAEDVRRNYGVGVLDQEDENQAEYMEWLEKKMTPMNS